MLECFDILIKPLDKQVTNKNIEINGSGDSIDNINVLRGGGAYHPL